MATLALAAAGAAVGGAVLPAGVTVFGATLSGAAIGSQLGALAGSFIDHELFGSSGETRSVEGPRLRDLHVTGSSEGAPIPRLYGRARLGGQVIWASDFEEVAVTTEAESGGGGGGKGSSGGSSAGTNEVRTDYVYYANFAVAIAEGEVTSLGRIWADGSEITLSDYTYRFYNGTDTQSADSLISSYVGSTNAPAYRGVSYIVFERMPLAEFGNRMPQLSFEVFRAVEPFGEEIRGIVLIPGSGEFVYATQQVNKRISASQREAENVHNRIALTDWAAAMDQLQATLPNAKSISLVVSWFGTDLRVGSCEVRPGVEVINKDNDGIVWQAGGVDRLQAHVVSQREGRPAYGGTPADFTVIQAIRDLNLRGMSVTLAPFVLMDIPEGNTLPNPYGGVGQPPYPWRGRITVDPAPDQAGTPDKTAAAASQVAAFVGTVQLSHFAILNDTVIYSGPAEWSYRRMVLHQAHLAKAAGGVDAFLIGTELRAITWIRDSAATYPFVNALVQLAADVKALLGPATKVTYAADWSEYFGHQPSDGSGDVYFHLDPLWASANVDAIGIDCYWPLADWREGTSHLDYQAGARSTYEIDYLKSNVRGGEGFDWYYASQTHRDGQIRTPITDGAGKPWVFRYKDAQSWWSNYHYNRPGGTESATSTGWIPQSKPIWVMEIGCPATDKGANQPNVFVDPKSSENFLPYYSRGVRDDFMQRRYLQALINAFDSSHEGYVPGANPVSSVYGGPMVPLDKVFVYCWDVRPYPAFPYNTDVWGDGENWRLGHWLTGRFSGAPLAETVAKVLDDSGFSNANVGGLSGSLSGYVVDRVMAPRDALQPLGLAYFFDAHESGGTVNFRHRGQESPVLTLEENDFVEASVDTALSTFTRGQETELPASTKVSYISSLADYQQAVAESRRLTGESTRVSQAELPIVLESEQAAQIADTWLFETWAARERVQFTLPPSQLAIEPGDLLNVRKGERDVLLRVTEVADHGARDVEARSINRTVYGPAPAAPRPPRPSSELAVGPALGAFLDLPLLRGDEPPESGYFAAAREPWPGGVALYNSPSTTGYVLRKIATREAVIGEILTDLPPGPVGRWDYGSKLLVEVSGQLTSTDPMQLLSGQNIVAVHSDNGNWEVLQFAHADLVGNAQYELSQFLRGQAGTESEMTAGMSAGAQFVLLDVGLVQIDILNSELGLPLNWRYGPAGKDIGDESYVDAVHAFKGLGRRPLSPVHIKGQRSAGQLEITWLRRTRIGGDNWDSVEVPLSETRELYEVDILDGASVVRTLNAVESNVVYTESEQIQDFGSVPSAISLRVYQLNETWGRGVGGAAIV